MAFQRKLWGECARLGAHYALLFALFPARVLLPAVFLSGLLTATIVTVSHVTEDIFFDGPHKVSTVGLVDLLARPFSFSFDCPFFLTRSDVPVHCAFIIMRLLSRALIHLGLLRRKKTCGSIQVDYVESQFRSTRDFVCSNPGLEYLAGGMNYQLEHHLFPTMPRYMYPKLVPVIKKFAAENNLPYKVTRFLPPGPGLSASF